MAATTTLRCEWAGSHADYVAYHDDEWGRPTVDPNRLFEKICLEGFQSGLSWLTILRKRTAFREAFQNFDIEVVANYGDADVERLLQNAAIIRHRGKIEATINNARRALELLDAEGSMVDWIWSWAVTEAVRHEGPDGPSIPAQTARSAAFAKELKRRGWRFFGPTTAYAFMQSEGLTNDHVSNCIAHGACEVERTRVLAGRTLRPDPC